VVDVEDSEVLPEAAAEAAAEVRTIFTNLYNISLST
jgi:hypothetical protein